MSFLSGKYEIDEANGCWLWLRAKDANGYGRTYFQSKDFLAHRVSWIIANGQIPNGLCVLHKCDVPACINPDHLFLGTQADNLRDMRRKGRNVDVQPPDNSRAKNPMAKLSEDDIDAIRQMHGSMSQRAIAEMFNVHQSTVSRIHAKKRWRDGT